jgi:hypothetical protein
VRTYGPYVALALLPGGTFIALATWMVCRHRSAVAHE